LILTRIRYPLNASSRPSEPHPFDMAVPHVLLLGGHGKVSQRLTPLLLAKSWTVTSLIRNADQVATIEALGANQPGQLHVLVRSLEDVTTEQKARAILDQVGAPWVIWSAGTFPSLYLSSPTSSAAEPPPLPPPLSSLPPLPFMASITNWHSLVGAGGRGGPTITHAVDSVAARHFASAAVHAPAVTHYLTVSYPGSRRTRPSWWSDAAWAGMLNVNNNVLPAYAQAKIEADEHLTALALARPDFAAICLRPGTLTLEEGGKVQLGKIDGQGVVSRLSVAKVAAELMARTEEWKKGKCTWLDLMDGEGEIADEVARSLSEGVDTVEGEDIEAMKAAAAQPVV
jgi:hypothetical protein